MDRNKQLTEFVIDIMKKCNGAQLNVSEFDEVDRELAEALNTLSRYNCEAKRFATDIAEGNLESEPPEQDNAISWPFRALRSSLLHLTWQSQRVAAGDYNQHVDFLGDFSEAFNDMIYQLSIREKTLRMTSEHQSRKLEEMEQIVYKDEATGAYNRRYCMALIDEMLRRRIPFCLGYVDLNNLKEVNDNFGHEAGDTYIEEVIASLRDTLRQEDVVCRIGGDEIIVILYHCTEEKGLHRMEESQKCIQKLGTEYQWELSISYGVVEVGSNTAYNTQDLLKEADRRMYEFKTAYKKEHHLLFHS
ncbi:MAG: diguanylate cyclase [Hespellia sp.]|nr:diguanylate cyclase [Hespellia sp.]